MQMGELAEHVAVFRVEPLHEGRVIQLCLAVGLAHVTQRVQALQDRLPPRRIELLPPRQERLANVSLLLRRQLLPHALALAQRLLLIGREAIPGFEPLANLGLLLGRQAQETLIVPQKLFLAPGGHVLQPLNRFRRQIVGIALRPHRIRQIGTHLRPRRGTRSRALLLRRSVRSLSASRTAHGSREQQSPKDSSELEPKSHYLVSLAPSLGEDDAAGPGSSDSASNFETTS